ncbi:MAG TPA: hypothetical protein VF146_07690 [Bryobacteraceae bacterium]
MGSHFERFFQVAIREASSPGANLVDSLGPVQYRYKRVAAPAIELVATGQVGSKILDRSLQNSFLDLRAETRCNGVGIVNNGHQHKRSFRSGGSCLDGCLGILPAQQLGRPVQ